MSRRQRFSGTVVSILLLAAAARGQADSYSVDPHHRTIENWSPFSSVNSALPATLMGRLCGDLDGCTVRLVATYLEGYDVPATSLVTRFFTTDGSGLDWRVFSEDAIVGGGSADDVMESEIAKSVAGPHACVWRDDPASAGYVLAAQNLELTGGVRCSIRIDD